MRMKTIKGDGFTGLSRPTKRRRTVRVHSFEQYMGNSCENRGSGEDRKPSKKKIRKKRSPPKYFKVIWWCLFGGQPRFPENLTPDKTQLFKKWCYHKSERRSSAISKPSTRSLSQSADLGKKCSIQDRGEQPDFNRTLWVHTSLPGLGEGNRGNNCHYSHWDWKTFT